MLIMRAHSMPKCWAACEAICTHQNRWQSGQSQKQVPAAPTAGKNTRARMPTMVSHTLQDTQK